MKNEILDDKSYESESDLIQTRTRIRKIESRNWYGSILISVVMGFILISMLVYLDTSGFSMPVILINSLLICIHVILLFLSKTDKLLAYTGGLFIFVITVVLNLMLTKVFFMNRILLTLVIIGSYVFFIFEEFQLKRLKSRLEE